MNNQTSLTFNYLLPFTYCCCDAAAFQCRAALLFSVQISSVYTLVLLLKRSRTLLPADWVSMDTAKSFQRNGA